MSFDGGAIVISLLISLSGCVCCGVGVLWKVGCDGVPCSDGGAVMADCW